MPCGDFLFMQWDLEKWRRKIVWLVKLPAIALLHILQSNIKARGCINREAKITECCQTKQQPHASRQAAPLKAVMYK